LLQQLPQAPLQTTPSCWQLPVPVVPGCWHVPTVAPEARWHHPLQQSVSRAQTSPGWMHQEDPSTHLPLLHRPEQHVVAPPSVAPHGLPAVAHVVLSGLHVPPLQLPLQHDAELEQVWLSATQLVALAQTPREVSHWRLQQSVGALQAPPAAAQVTTEDVQTCIDGSQAFEQHCAFVVHDAPVTVHVTPEPPAPEMPAVPDTPAAPAVPLAPAVALAPAPPPRPPFAPLPPEPELALLELPQPLATSVNAKHATNDERIDARRIAMRD
jgi:hypothetical protein